MKEDEKTLLYQIYTRGKPERSCGRCMLVLSYKHGYIKKIDDTWKVTKNGLSAINRIEQDRLLQKLPPNLFIVT